MNEPLLYHAVREPSVETREPAPVLVLLHGLRSNESDLMALAPSLDARFFVVSARAPLRMSHGAYAWYDVGFINGGYDINERMAAASRDRLLAFVRQLPDLYNVDRSRVFAMGFSQGAAMCVSAALTEPSCFAGVVAMSGRFIAELEPSLAPADRTRGLPSYVAHGLYDAVIPIEHGRELRDQLTRRGADLTYREYPMGHEVTPESMGGVSQWLSDRLGA